MKKNIDTSTNPQTSLCINIDSNQANLFKNFSKITAHSLAQHYRAAFKLYTDLAEKYGYEFLLNAIMNIEASNHKITDSYGKLEGAITVKALADNINAELKKASELDYDLNNDPLFTKPSTPLSSADQKNLLPASDNEKNDLVDTTRKKIVKSSRGNPTSLHQH